MPGTNGVKSVPSGQWLVVCAVCRCWFYTNHWFSWENFCHIVFACVIVNTNFWASGMIFLSFSFMYVVRVFNWCSAGYYWILVSTLKDEQRITTDRLFSRLWPFWEMWHLNRRLAFRKPLDPSCLSLFSLFFSVYLAFLCTVVTIVYFCPLLIFWSWWILMVCPCRLSTLLEETTTARDQATE